MDPSIDTSNPVLFLISCLQEAARCLGDFSFWGVPIWTWFIGFIFTGMVISVFWRGARG